MRDVLQDNYNKRLFGSMEAIVKAYRETPFSHVRVLLRSAYVEQLSWMRENGYRIDDELKAEHTDWLANLPLDAVTVDP